MVGFYLAKIVFEHFFYRYPQSPVNKVSESVDSRYVILLFCLHQLFMTINHGKKYMGVDSLGAAMLLAYEFKTYRLQNGLEPDDLAEALGLPVEAIKQIENCTAQASTMTRQRFRALSMQDDASERTVDEFIKLVETSQADMLLFDPDANLIATSKLHKEARKYDWKDIRYRSRVDLEPDSTLRLCEEAGALGASYNGFGSFDKIYCRGPDKVNTTGVDIWGRIVSRPLILGSENVWRIATGVILPYSSRLKPTVRKID